MNFRSGSQGCRKWIFRPCNGPGSGFQNVFKIIAFDLDTLFFVQKISYDLKSKIVSY